MPGLCGFVTGARRSADPKHKLALFDKIHYIPEVRSVTQGWSSSHCAILNCQTGLLPHASERHSEDVQTGTHLFLEGEVCNYEQILDLADVVRGGDGKSWTPTEKLLVLFLKEGPSFIRHLRGEFAVAIYEEHPHRLHLFTDHLATKSIYYLVDHEGLFFGSEKKSILAASTSGASLDPVGLLEVFALTHNIGDKTFVAQIRCLPPASYLLFEGGRVAISKYWQLEFNISNDRRPIADLRDEWAELLTKATLRRVKGKSRLLLFLSGGLDSRAVACALPRDLRPLTARTRGYNDAFEVQCASSIAQTLGFDHYVENPEQVPLSQFLERIVWRTECGIPFTDCLSIADHSRIAERGDFILGGQLGDVGSGGHIHPRMLIPQSRKAFLNSIFERYPVNPLPKLRKIFNDEFLEQVFPEFRKSFFESFEAIGPQHSNIQLYEIWDMVHRQSRRIFNSQKVDSHRFELIYPLSDFDYLEFALSLPFHLRFGQTLYQSMIWALGPEIRDIPYANTGRRISPLPLVNCGRRLLYYKDKVVERCQQWRDPKYQSKFGSGRPSIKLDPAVRDIIESYVSSSAFECSVFDSSKILATMKEHYEHGINHGPLISTLATFAVGLPLFLKKNTVLCPYDFTL